MHDEERFRLFFGPYGTPRFRYGAIVQDAIRGPVRITGLSSGPIPWPRGLPLSGRGGPQALVIYGALARAIGREARIAVAHWWGVKPRAVSTWRRALGVPATTPGTTRLRSAHGRGEPVRRSLNKAHEQSRHPARDAARREKLAAARRGKPMPRANLDAKRKTLEKQRRRRSVRRLLKGTSIGAPPWTLREDEYVRSLSVAEVVKKTGRTRAAVYRRRSMLGLQDARRRPAG